MVEEEDDVICRERIKPRKLAKSQNIVHRLRNREHFGYKSEISYQEFFQCIGINLTVVNYNIKNHNNLFPSCRSQT